MELLTKWFESTTHSKIITKSQQIGKWSNFLMESAEAQKAAEDPCLIQISLLRFFKTSQKNLAYAFFEPIYFISAIFGPKIAQKLQ